MTTPPPRSVVLFFVLACHGRDDSALNLEVDCTPVDQYAPSGKSAPSGYEYCAVDTAAGFMHRVEAVDVADDPFRDPDAGCNDEAFPDDCKSTADCEKGNVCEMGKMTLGCHCVPKCRTDADCGAGAACLPRMIPLEGKRVLSGDNSCIAATCLTDADCPSGWCVLSSPCSGQGGSLHCFGPKDECNTAADCSDGKECYSDSDGRFECNYTYSCE